MPEGGTLTIATDVVHLADDELQRHGLDAAGGGHLELRVVDTGLGMDDEVKAHLFEPFFTTKPQGKGTGMGLAAVYGTVRSHGGAISVTSAPGAGTTFRILLPLFADPVTAGREESSVRSGVRPLTILIIDDEAMLRDMLAEILVGGGHTVHQAANGVEGIAAFRRLRGLVDLIILDLVMPEMNGRDCFRALKAIDPEVRVLLESGYSLDGEAQAILADGARAFIQKPFRRDELLRRMADAMAG